MKKVNEFERKFLLLNAPLAENSSIQHIVQIYLNDGTRFRIISYPNAEIKYELIKKEKIKDGFNTEIELTPSIIYTIDDALEQNLPFIEKKRQSFFENDQKFEIDTFLNINLTILEIETKTQNETIQIPEWLSKYILCEVTDSEIFSNLNLAKQLMKIRNYHE